MTRVTDHEKSIRRIPCRTCKAAPGERCVTKTVNPMTMSHTARTHDSATMTRQAVEEG